MQIAPLTSLKPQHVRVLTLAIGLLLLASTWVGYFFTSRSINHSFTRSTIASLTGEAGLLDEHLNRSLNQITNTLISAGSLAELMPDSSANLTPDILKQLLGNTRLIRSLSILDSNDNVLTSSNPANIGQMLPVEASVRSFDDRYSIQGSVFFGEILPYRDLLDWSSGRTSSTQELIPAYLSFHKGGEKYTLIAAINVSLFYNLWDRINHSKSIEVAVYNYRGQRVIVRNENQLASNDVFNALASEIKKQQIGYFTMPQNPNFWVFYRANTGLPKILVTIANMDELSQDIKEEDAFLLVLAAVVSLFIVLILLATYRLYLRHERAAIFTQNLLGGITTHLMMTRADTDGKIQDVNEPLLIATGYSRDELIGQNHRIFKSGLQPDQFYDKLWKTILKGNIWTGTFRNKTKAGEILWMNATIVPFKNEWGNISSYVAMYSDFTKAALLAQDYERERKTRQALESLNQQLLSDATKDPLTGVSNRRGLDQFIDEITHTDLLAGLSVSVLMLDLDNFKQINDTWGHVVGDCVLKTLTSIWKDSIRSSDLLVRLGGEEFAVILLRTSLEGAKNVADLLLTRTRDTQIKVEGKDEALYVTVSIGVAHNAKASDVNIESLLKEADAALYAAKREGKDQVKMRQA